MRASKQNMTKLVTLMTWQVKHTLCYKLQNNTSHDTL